MTFHRAFLLEMEQSLLSVAPALKALPYWDITVSAQLGMMPAFAVHIIPSNAGQGGTSPSSVVAHAARGSRGSRLESSDHKYSGWGLLDCRVPNGHLAQLSAGSVGRDAKTVQGAQHANVLSPRVCAAGQPGRQVLRHQQVHMEQQVRGEQRRRCARGLRHDHRCAQAVRGAPASLRTALQGSTHLGVGQRRISSN